MVLLLYIGFINKFLVCKKCVSIKKVSKKSHKKIISEVDLGVNKTKIKSRDKRSRG